MPTPDRIKQHAALLDRMAEAVGVDLEGAVMSGRLPMDDLADSVLHCTDCARPQLCETWLENKVGRPPDFCLNHAVLIGLRAGGDAPEDKETTRCG
ncbi:DUF6455 family protein [Sedimentitalea arenosa]|jgi:hypothetical protein|uniref:DUF6455 domain-containing protein n=1 Tax=Sedimentitalea arenosa TaxID=2798803 RepID=A0A8J7J6T1_9RHOB|nr:DUF6455 family protein [Arenibacterium arenosum]MBJ6371332.1 hypothetical protein [Arenibacterium arenosum]